MLKALLIAGLVLNLCIIAKTDDASTDAAAGGDDSSTSLPGAAPGVDYCTLKCKGEENSACKCVIDEAACGGKPEFVTMDDPRRAEYLRMHNVFRERVASGTEKEGGNVGATDMQVMAYDKELEYMTNCYIRKCVSGHDTCRLTDKWKAEMHQVGQNIYEAYSLTNLDQCSTYVNHSYYGWFGEVNETSVSCIKDFNNCDLMTVGHYTQMVWATTTHVGCTPMFFKKGGSTTCRFICNYGPSGNWGGKRAYTLGPPARDCVKTDSTYKSLCVGMAKSGEHDVSAGYRFQSVGYIFTTILSFAGLLTTACYLPILNVSAY